MAKGWRYYLGNSSDMEIVSELKHAHGRALEVDNNKSGSSNYWVPIGDQPAGKVWPWETCTIIQHDDDIFWSGPNTSRTTDMSSGQVAVSAVGWFERFMHLLLLDFTTSYVDKDAGFIISDLVAKARALDPSLPITMGTVVPSQIRTITYSRDQSIGQAIIDLGVIESGVDWYIDPVTRKLNVVPRRGVDRPDVKWTFIGDMRSQQSNLSNCVESVDGNTITNSMRPRGKVASGFAEDAMSRDRYGLFMDNPSLSDVSDTSILNAFANAEMVYRAQPRVLYELTPKPSSKGNVPKLFRDFDIGDTTYLTARRGHVDIVDQATRMFGVGLAITDVGVEILNKLQTTA